MRRAWWGLVIVVLCLPLAFSLWLLAAARMPALDASTARLPAVLRSSVAEAILHSAAHGPKALKPIDRALRLDPDSEDGWSRRCSLSEGAEKLTACSRSLSLSPSMWNYDHVGDAESALGDFCAAERSYTTANRRYIEATHFANDEDVEGDQDDATQAIFVRNMGVAALRCGHLPDSRAALEVAETLDIKLAQPDLNDADGEAEFKEDLAHDRESLSIVYDRQHEAAKSAEACGKAHPTWKTCHCDLTGTAIACAQANASMRTAR